MTKPKPSARRAQAARNAAARTSSEASARSAKGAVTKRLNRSQRDIARAEKVGLNQRGVQGWVPVAALFSDPRYQRDVDKRVVDRMAREFDPDALGVIYVSERSNGSYAVMDGGHRVATMRQLGWDDQTMPALIYSGLTIEEEAHIFHEMNAKRRLPKRIDLFRAEVTAGDSEAVKLSKIMVANGVQASTSPGAANIRAIATVQKALLIAGEQVIDRGIKIARAAWPTHDDALNGDVLNGIFLLLFAYPDLDDKHLIKNLGAFMPMQILNKGRATKEILPDMTPPAALAHVLVNTYNTRKRTGRLAAPYFTGWPKRTANGVLYANGWSDQSDMDET